VIFSLFLLRSGISKDKVALHGSGNSKWHSVPALSSSEALQAVTSDSLTAADQLYHVRTAWFTLKLEVET
jgi:hypothetical protein